MKVKINDKEIELKKSFRSYVIYENVTGNSFSIKTMTDLITYFYCVLISSEKNIEIQFDEFMDYLDNTDGVMEEFMEWFQNVNDIDSKLTKKKKTTKKEK